MPRLLVSTRKRVIILRRQGYALKDIQRRLEQEDIVVSLRSLQRLCAKFKRVRTIRDLPRASKRRLLTPQMLSAMDESLRDNDELTARKLRDTLREKFTELPQVSLSTIKRYLYYVTFVVLLFLSMWYGLIGFHYSIHLWY